MIPEKYAIVAIWSEGTYLYGRTWTRNPHYIFIGPTGPRASSYWVTDLGGWWGAKSKKVRIPSAQVKCMLTQEQWGARWAAEVKAEEQAKIMDVLSH